MAKIVVQHDVDPAIGIVLAENKADDPGPTGFSGKCTECGWAIHGWLEPAAIRRAKAHVDGHDAVVTGEH